MGKRREVTDQGMASHTETAPRVERSTAPARLAGQATIGRAITIRGDVTGDEDLMIQGRVEGSVSLEQYAVTVGPSQTASSNWGTEQISLPWGPWAWRLDPADAIMKLEARKGMRISIVQDRGSLTAVSCSPASCIQLLWRCADRVR